MIGARTPMDGVDAAWLRMDRATNPMVIHGLMVLEGRCTLAELRRVIRSRFLAHARFRAVPLAETIGGTCSRSPVSAWAAVRTSAAAGRAALVASTRPCTSCVSVTIPNRAVPS